MAKTLSSFISKDAGIITLIFALILLRMMVLSGQVESDSARNKVGFGVGPSYVSGARNFAGSFRVHYIRSIDDRGQFAITPSIGIVFDDDGHVSAGIGYVYRPVDFLHLGTGPGLKFLTDGRVELMIFFEVLYEMNFNWFFAGPLFKYDWSPDSQNLMFGLYFGLDF